ncbi:hypothetical protein ILP97_18240 [Amycolatopsis sp. H6(2020)]|nr:hypothetical protein [Amycolatopsis sp. H6(2020)]
MRQREIRIIPGQFRWLMLGAVFAAAAAGAGIPLLRHHGEVVAGEIPAAITPIVLLDGLLIRVDVRLMMERRPRGEHAVSAALRFGSSAGLPKDGNGPDQGLYVGTLAVEASFELSDLGGGRS